MDKIDEYKNIMCPNCINNNSCNKDSIKIKTILDKTTIICNKYQYIKEYKEYKEDN